MSRKKRKLESFDVADFLRESDDDLKSALNSLLRSPATEFDPVQEEGVVVLSLPVAPPTGNVEGLSAHPGEVRAMAAPSISPIPGIKLTPAIDPAPAPDHLSFNATPGIKLIPGTEIKSPSETAPDAAYKSLIPNRMDATEEDLAPPEEQSDHAEVEDGQSSLIPGLKLTSPPSSIGRKQRHYPIREMRLAQDAHTRAEQQVYESLWDSAKVHDDISRIITIGFGAMARMVRLSESNARINVRNLISKLAIEEMGNYNCEYAIGRTYRIFNYSEIQRRRRQAGLTWYMKRTLAVVFVDPVTKEPIDLGSKKRIQQGPLNSKPGPNLRPDPGPKLGPPPGPNLIPLTVFREKEFREKLLREDTPSSSSLFQALSQYAAVDDDVMAKLRSAVRAVCEDATDDEIVHFVHTKGALLQQPNHRIANPAGYMIIAVPKCFASESIEAFRREQSERLHRERLDQDRQQAELEAWRQTQQAVLDDPEASKEARYWARKWLYPEESQE